MNRGLEISADAADSPRAVIVEQVANGVAVRMAVLYLLLAGDGDTAGAVPATGAVPALTSTPAVAAAPTTTAGATA
jgi:aspartate carbamoyltransferase catalytic subunit